MWFYCSKHYFCCAKFSGLKVGPFHFLLKVAHLNVKQIGITWQINKTLLKVIIRYLFSRKKSACKWSRCNVHIPLKCNQFFITFKGMLRNGAHFRVTLKVTLWNATNFFHYFKVMLLKVTITYRLALKSNMLQITWYF